MYKIFRIKPSKEGRKKRISLTANPAIELKTVMLSDDIYNLDDYMVYDDERRILSGPAIIPNKLIPRRGDDGEIILITLTNEDVDFFHQLWKEDGMELNIEHTDKIISGKILFSKILAEGDDIKNYPHNLPPYTLYLETEYSKEDWEYIKKNKLNGYSIEFDGEPEPFFFSKNEKRTFSYGLDLSKIMENAQIKKLEPIILKRSLMVGEILKDFIKKI
jgi:hypothetical protein